MAVAAADLICEYCEAATHEILYLRSIYDRDIFQRERLYGIAVHKSRHPALNLYISDSILSLKDAIKQGKAQKVAISVLGAGGQVHERFVITLQIEDVEGSLDATQSEAFFRGSLLKLQFSEARLKSLPGGCTFEIVVCVKDTSAVDISEWVEETAQEGSQKLTTLIPIKSSATPPIKMQLHVETF